MKVFYYIVLLFYFTFSVTFVFAKRYFVENPDTYQARLRSLQPGDHLHLIAGKYKNGLPVHRLRGSAIFPITISGPKHKPYAVFEGRSGHNTISIINAEYIVIKNLVLDGHNLPVDGVKCEGHADWAHHITLDGLKIYRHGHNQQIVGISTKCPAWNWIIRNNKIIGAGTGLYLGNSDGQDAFIGGLIEYNLITDSIGYNLQIKHQQKRPVIPGIPNKPGTTIIRHNVFSKANDGSQEIMARPNVLVGHWPLSGAGMNDRYAIYGNFFYQNPHESLFQGEGNIALYNNLFVNHHGDAIHIQPHNDVPRHIDIFYNTVISSGNGIRLINRTDSPSYPKNIIGNAIFADKPLPQNFASKNLTSNFKAANQYIIKPLATINKINLEPLSGKLKYLHFDTSLLRDYPDWNRDYNDVLRSIWQYGAYTSSKPFKLPRLEIKPK